MTTYDIIHNTSDNYITTYDIWVSLYMTTYDIWVSPYMTTYDILVSPLKMNLFSSYFIDAPIQHRNYIGVPSYA